MQFLNINNNNFLVTSRLGALSENAEPASAVLPTVKEVAGQQSSSPSPIQKEADFRSPPITKEAEFRSPPVATGKEVDQKSPAAVKVEAEQRLPPPEVNSPAAKEEAEQKSLPGVKGATGKQRPQRVTDGTENPGPLTLPALRAFLTASSTVASPGTRKNVYRKRFHLKGQ
jgi:hypothetical protein